jgi:hypothetical protein
VNTMQPEPQQAPLVDPGNPFALGQYPSTFGFGHGMNAQGEPVLIVSVRCGPASLPVLLTREQAEAVAKLFAQAAALVSPLMVPSPNNLKQIILPRPGQS